MNQNISISRPPEVMKKKKSKTKLLLILTIIVVVAFCFLSLVKEKKYFQTIAQTNDFLTAQNNQFRAFVFGACQINGFSADYYFVEGEDCQYFFPELFNIEEVQYDLETSFIDLINIFVVDKQENENLIKEIFLLNDYSSAKQGDASDDLWTDFQNIIAKEQLVSYLADYDLTAQKIKDYSYEIMLQDEKLLEIYYSSKTNKLEVAFEDKQVLRLDNLNQVVAQAQFILSQFSNFDLEHISQISVDELDDKRFDNFLLLGKHEKNVDTIILAVVDHQKKRITMVSLPRDLWVDQRKINSYYYFFGIHGFVKKVESVVGQKIDNYVLIDMYAFPEVIDKLGGLEYVFDAPLIDPTYKTIDNGVEGTLYFPAGKTILNGKQALRVARSRHTSSDFARSARQQGLLASLKNKIAQTNKIELSKLAPIFFDKVDTDMSFVKVLPYVVKIKDYEIRPGNVISTGNILTSGYFEYDEHSRAYILTPKDDDWALIKKYIINKVYEN